MVAGSDFAASDELGRCLVRGLSRIATVADGAKNHDYVAARSISWTDLVGIIDQRSGRVPASEAFHYFLNHIESAPCRYYRLGAADGTSSVLGYAYTANNHREFAFLQRLLDAHEIPISVVNVCAAPKRKVIGVSGGVQEVVVAAVRALFEGREDLAPGLLQAVCKFATSVQGAIVTLSKAKSRKFVVANDHSPAPVAYAAVARAFGSSVIYVQHAEVSNIFPPLDFDLSILRSRNSAEVYKSIGAPRGRVVVAARSSGWINPDDINETRTCLINAVKVACVIYPSSVVELSELKALVAALNANDSVVSIQLKLHPRSELEGSSVSSLSLDVLETAPDFPHIAVCGNSSIVAELFERGNLVFQFDSLDRIAKDYYGFIRAGLSDELVLGDAGVRFWAQSHPLSQSEMSRAAAFVPRVREPENVGAWHDVSSALSDCFAVADL
ncbi:hypothetical protein [Brevibacterium yomogidense]|uniref:hypothetical protein n=1 Tax=Brevibacterium yomogidense TaxID=946573 RepID=UPI00117751EA|nr:hypothetical protein [Brevibacterium yomogidense]